MTDITATPCPTCLARKGEWCKDPDGRTRGGALLTHPARLDMRIVWEGVGASCKYLAIMESKSNNTMWGIALDPAIREVKSSSWHIPYDDATEAVRETCASDYALYRAFRGTKTGGVTRVTRKGS